MSLAHLKKREGNSIAKLQQKLDELKSRKSDKGDIYWKLTVDKAGNGYAEIRLLPPKEGEEYPFVKIKELGIGIWHEDIKKKKWYIERSLETIGKPDPVKDEFWAYMNKGDDESKKFAKSNLNSRDTYIVWIYIVNDKNAPENNGKVMKAKLSPSIWKYVENMISPDETDIELGKEPTDVFDLWEGSNFIIRAYNGTNDMRSYDKSGWKPAAPLSNDDEKLEEIYSQVLGLENEIDPSNPVYSKSYEELEKKLSEVLGKPLLKNQDNDSSEADLAAAFGTSVEEVSPVSATSLPERESSPMLNIDDDAEAELLRLISDDA